jgi:two-component system, chemotaxis family, sensor kinase CheA
MGGAAQQVLPPGLQSEFDSMRDQRDLYRSLLMSEPEPLALFMRRAMESVGCIRSTLRLSTRDSCAFRGKIERLQMELMALEQSLAQLRLPTVSQRLQTAAVAVNEIALRAEITGNDLLPSMVVLEELCSHLLVAADCAAVHVPLNDDDDDEEELEASQRRAQRRLVTALQQMSEKLTTEYGKSMSLVTMGLEDIPDGWGSALFDLLGQLLRNAVEHGIEPASDRLVLAKPEIGTMVIEFEDKGPQGYQLNVQDDGGGLDCERLAEVAIRLGLLTSDAARSMDPSRVVSLMFHPGVTTALDPARRGLGMQIVREHIQRLGGKLHVAAKRGQFVRFQITLPPYTPSD